jgi:hypothetical protein
MWRACMLFLFLKGWYAIKCRLTVTAAGINYHKALLATCTRMPLASLEANEMPKRKEKSMEVKTIILEVTRSRSANIDSKGLYHSTIAMPRCMKYVS